MFPYIEVDADQVVKELSLAFRDAPLQSVKQGRLLKKPGSILKMEAGCVGHVRALADAREQILDLYIPGDLLNLREAFSLAAHRNIECLSSRAQFRSRSIEDLKAVVGEEVLNRAARLLALENERISADRLVGLGRGFAEERYAAFLLEVRDRMLRSAMLSEPGVEFDLSLKQEQLGDYLGLSTIHINRTVKKLASHFRGRCKVSARTALKLLKRAGRDAAYWNQLYASAFDIAVGSAPLGSDAAKRPARPDIAAGRTAVRLPNAAKLGRKAPAGLPPTGALTI